MSPVENETFGRARVWSEKGHERLNKGQHGGHYPDDGMRVSRHWQRRPASQFDKNENKSNDRQQPRDGHQNAMKLAGTFKEEKLTSAIKRQNESNLPQTKDLFHRSVYRPK